MSNILSEIISIDKTIHEPVRIAILTILTVVEKADFLYIKNYLGITQGNLSSHINKLENAGFIEIEKKFKGKRPSTILSITVRGAENFKNYLNTIKKYIAESGI
jgi:DNA-binding MarR family transcriptional regulator